MTDKVVGFYESTADRILNRLGLSSERTFPEWNRGRSGGGGVARGFELVEDAKDNLAWAVVREYSPVGLPYTVYPPSFFRVQVEFFRSPYYARFGYKGIAVLAEDKKTWIAVGGECLANVGQAPAANFTLPTPPNGEYFEFTIGQPISPMTIPCPGINTSGSVVSLHYFVEGTSVPSGGLTVSTTYGATSVTIQGTPIGPSGERIYILKGTALAGSGGFNPDVVRAFKVVVVPEGV